MPATRSSEESASRLQRTISESATPARIGGDRFASVVPNLPGTSMARWTRRLDRRLFRGAAIIDEIDMCERRVKVGIRPVSGGCGQREDCS